MSNLDEKQKPVTQKASELKSVAETISNQYQGLQTKLSQAAQEAGYGQHQFAKLAKVIEKTPNDSLLEPLGNVLNKHSDYLRLIEGKMYIPTRLGERAFIAVSTAASTSAVVMSLNYKDVKAAMGFTPDPPPFAPQNTDPQRLAKLKRINPELAKIYSSVLEVYYATQNNPERAAMYQMREFIVQFFDLLAPGMGKGRSRSQVIDFVARKYIKNQSQAELHAAEAQTIIEIYTRLNAAHERDAIDPAMAERLIKDAKRIMDSWVDDITVP